MKKKSFDSSKSIIKIENHQLIHPHSNPCNPPKIISGAGSGFVVDIDGKNYVVTNAHVVESSAHMTLSLPKSPKKYPAKVKFISHECDLALIEIQDLELAQFVEPLKITDKYCAKQTEVTAYGYPIGGQDLSESICKVSRIEVQQYVHSKASLPAYEIEGFATFGNSGGPIIFNEEVVGVAAQIMHKKAHAIPSPVLQRFLNAYRLNKKVDLPSFGIEIQPLTNDFARKNIKNLQLFPEHGIRVTKINKLSSANGALQEGDVILKINGNRIRQDGKYVDPQGNLFTLHGLQINSFIDDICSMLILRDGQPKEIKFSLMNGAKDFKLVNNNYDNPASFLIKTGIVLQSLEAEYIYDAQAAFFHLGKAEHPFTKMLAEKKDEKDKQVIFINSVLPLEITEGYHDVQDAEISEINGKKINNWDDVLEAIYQDNSNAINIKIKKSNVVISIPKLSHEEELELLEQFGIHKDMSSDIENKVEFLQTSNKKPDWNETFLNQYQASKIAGLTKEVPGLEKVDVAKKRI